MFSRLLMTVFTVVLFLSNYTQASSLSTIDIEGVNQTIFKLDSNSSKDDLFLFFDTLKESFEINAQLISYKARNGKVMVLGIAFQEKTQRSTKFIIKSNSEIDDLCIVINNVTNIVSYAGSCDEDGPSILHRDPVQEAKERKIYNARVEKLKQYKQRIKDIFVKEDITVEYDEIADDQKQAAQKARENSRRNQSSGGYSTLSQAVNKDYNARKDSLRKVKEAKLELERLKAEEIALQTKHRKDSLKKARASRQNGLMPRDSVKKPVVIIVSESVEDQVDNAGSEVQSISSIQERNRIEDEQNTADVLNAIKQNTAGVDAAIESNTVFFSGEQCTYKVYSDKTFIYDSSDKTIMILDKPLANEPENGTTMLKGDTYSFEFDGLSLVLKNSNGMLINKEGNLLNPSASFDNEVAIATFQLTEEFVITKNSKSLDVQKLVSEIEKKKFNCSIIENISNTNNVITNISFKIDDKIYSFDGEDGIPVLLIQLDEIHHRARVQTAY
ncbi:hypothetical protein [Nonlabens ulvanivorans]|uniref:Uncharacterized protein n=1 Tax=Nonlabens ulvanivorans TaxID=906888 RepID=A0A084JVG1_NONUL|nr:hypothetical protein [Nonlabens ulvanivorans]KEZ92945.1 hypothetical protein IL45_12520 [Nonlabens ulvanivorans]PRX12825.1 hypothetical protein LY02_02477 [Nonlabens ulvanivorans]